VLGASSDRIGVRLLFGADALKKVSVKTSNLRRRQFSVKNRADSLAHTVALCASMLREPVRALMAARDDGVLVLHLLGCRWESEGTINMRLLLTLLDGMLPFRTLRLVLNGPELGPERFTRGAPSRRDLRKAKADLPRQARDRLQQIREASGDRLELIVRPGRWHSPAELPASPAEWELSVTDAARQERPDLALILNGGLDENFGSWAATLWTLLALGGPVALTGYGNADGSIGDTDSGSVQITHLLGGRAAAPVRPNPFRTTIPVMGMGVPSKDAWIASFEGASALVPGTASSLRAVQLQQRLMRLDDLVSLNRRDGRLDAAAKLRGLRSALASGEIAMKPGVNFTDMEQWSYGSCPPKW
jgi:hypothetical protein